MATGVLESGFTSDNPDDECEARSRIPQSRESNTAASSYSTASQKALIWVFFGGVLQCFSLTLSRKAPEGRAAPARIGNCC